MKTIKLRPVLSPRPLRALLHRVLEILVPPMQGFIQKKRKRGGETALIGYLGGAQII